MLGKLNFVKHLIGTGAEDTADALMQTLVKWNPARASKAERKQIAETLSRFCFKAEEARNKWKKEADDVVRVRQQAAQKIALLERWQEEMASSDTPQDRLDKIGPRIPVLTQELQDLSKQLDREIREEQVAKRVLDTYDKVVKVTEEKLATKDEAANSAAAELELLQAEEHLANEEVSAAKVLAGLTSASDSMDVATQAMNREIEETKTRIAAKQREAGSLGRSVGEEDDFMEAEMATMTGAPETVDFMAELKSKL